MFENRWDRLVAQFRNENFQLHQLNEQSALAVTLQAGLSALKTLYPLLYVYLAESMAFNQKISVYLSWKVLVLDCNSSGISRNIVQESCN